MKKVGITIKTLINGDYHTFAAEKFISGRIEEFDADIFRIKLTINKITYINTKECDTMETALIDLQRALLPDVLIACCQSCVHGNFCPYGNNEDEIFCLKDCAQVNEFNVYSLFANNLVFHGSERMMPRHNLLHWCGEYRQATDAQNAAYNDWYAAIYHK